MHSPSYFAFIALSAIANALPIRNKWDFPHGFGFGLVPSSTLALVSATPTSTTLIPGPGQPASSTTPGAPAAIITTVAPGTPAASVAPSASPASSPSPAASSSTPNSAPSSGSPKYVFAHHIVGNTYPYTVQDWVDDITLAHASGIDAFALNIGSDDWEPDHVADAYTAATQSGTDFKLFISFDMTALPCASPSDGQLLRDYITKYATHPAQFKYNGRSFASTFAGDTCTFGSDSVVDGWRSQFTQNGELTGVNAVYFVPSFFVDPATFKTFDGIMDGDFNWNSGWPITLTTPVATQLLAPVGGLQALAKGLVQAVSTDPSSIVSAGLSALQNAFTNLIGATDTDTQHRTGLEAMPNGGSKTYMAAVSPWFFTHYGADSFNKNVSSPQIRPALYNILTLFQFIYVADDHLYSRRWESIFATRDQIDLVEIITWNDYGESHYVGPIKGSQPNSQAWVDGNEHTAWLALTSYYAEAYKTGVFPTITDDKLVLWARTHPAAVTVNDPVGKPTNFEITQDALWAVALLTAPATVTLSPSAAPAAGDPNTHTFSVPAGLTKLSIPLTAGATMYASITRNGQIVKEVQPTNFTFQGAPPSYNFNAFVVESD
jgi:glucan endo-1,3-alpha-glucosidase